MIRFVCTRSYSRLSLRAASQPDALRPRVQPTGPARTRFAPSPTGVLHLGSLRTALYNYLLARSTGGAFILRVEDTDQTRLVPGAENNIYESLRWCGLAFDEGPFKQSDRKHIYKKYADQLVQSGHAYHCNCTKERVSQLRESAMKLKPPTNVTYDRKCLHEPTSEPGPHTVVRFRSPDRYEPVEDLLHGTLNLQPQYNLADRRYDDIVLLKSDGLPTYHFANVVDDHLMNITHVIRGEEWITSAPKHVALYRAFGWNPPKFVHIPLLTSLKDKKLSKRSGDNGILSLREQGFLPEAVVNFVALFGWSPPRLDSGVSTSEVMSLEELVEKFSLDNLTKGNAKVSDAKLYHFNKLHLQRKLENQEQLARLVQEQLPHLASRFSKAFDPAYITKVFQTVAPGMSLLEELYDTHFYLFKEIEYESLKTPIPSKAKEILSFMTALRDLDPSHVYKELSARLPGLQKKDIFQSIRFAAAGNVPGLGIPVITDLIGDETYRNRVKKASAYLNSL